MLHDLKFYCRI